MWLNGDCLDGVKHVCLDDLKEDMESKKCLVYSFGLSIDWTFEEAMAGLGCTVRAFDPSTKKPASVSDKGSVTRFYNGLVRKPYFK